MTEKRWQWIFLLLMGVLLLGLGLSCLEPIQESENQVIVASATEDVRAYFPAFRGMTYYFVGEGMEYSAFSRRISHVAPGLIQIEDLTSGTNLAQVLEVMPEKLRSFWSEEEFFTDENLLQQGALEERDRGWSTDLVLLQTPLQKGNTWSDERFHRKIVATDQTVTVPLGTISDVIVVKNESVNSGGFIQYEYYAKNIGLIKREVLRVVDGETLAVVSNLKSITGPFPQ